MANLGILVKMYFILAQTNVMHSALVGPHFIIAETLLWNPMGKKYISYQTLVIIALSVQLENGTNVIIAKDIIFAAYEKITSIMTIQ